MEPSFYFKFDYWRKPNGNTLWQTIKNTFSKKDGVDMNVNGDLQRTFILKRLVDKEINVYLPAIIGLFKRTKYVVGGITYSYKVIPERLREDVCILILTMVIEHEYLHSTFDDLGLGLTSDQQEGIIKRVGIDIQEELDRRNNNGNR